MIVIAGRIEIDPADRENALTAAKAMSTASETEAGCISYRFYGGLDDPGVFFIFEEWENEAALTAHFQTPHMATFNQTLESITIKSMDIQRYDVSSVSKA